MLTLTVILVIVLGSLLLGYLVTKHLHGIASFTKRFLVNTLALAAFGFIVFYFATAHDYGGELVEPGTTDTLQLKAGVWEKFELETPAKVRIASRYTRIGDILQVDRELDVLDHKRVEKDGDPLEIQILEPGQYHVIQHSDGVREITITADP